MRSLTVTVVLLVFGLIILMSGCNSYNSFVDSDEDVENSWSNVQSEYQRRADLIPNLVNTVKGVADFEQKTLTDVVNARSKATSINIDPSNITEDQLKNFQEAQSGLSQSLGRLLMVSENYPQLRASESFRDLQVQLESTENRIKVARNRYNEQVTAYNKKVRKFPSSFYATIFSFERKVQFQAESGSEDAPTVDFN